MESEKQVKPNGTSRLSRYNALFFRIGLSILAGHIIVIYAQPKTTFDALLSPSYYRALGASIVIAFILISYVRFINISFDKKLTWERHALQRTLYQFALGLVIPGIMAFLMAALYFQLNGINILHTVYLSIDFPFIMVMLLCLNLYYVILYLINRLRTVEVIKATYEPKPPEKENVLRETFLVHTPVKVLPLRTEQICYFFRKNGHNFVHTFGSDVYAIPESLKEIEDRFGGQHFFRINRQMVINFEACVSFRPGKNKTLELTLRPPFSLKHRDEETHNGGGSFVTVSEDRVQAFKDWMNR
jgi:hypothetical protein